MKITINISKILAILIAVILCSSIINSKKRNKNKSKEGSLKKIESSMYKSYVKQMRKLLTEESINISNLNKRAKYRKADKNSKNQQNDSDKKDQSEGDNKSKDSSNDDLDNVIAKPKPNIGNATIIAGYNPLKYPKCILENKFQSEYKGNQDKYAAYLNTCLLEHIKKSVGFNEDLFNKCLAAFKSKVSASSESKPSGVFLARLMIYATYGESKPFLQKKFKWCPDFIDEVFTKVQKYHTNFKLSIAIFADLKNISTPPPKNKSFYQSDKKKQRKAHKNKK